ncbi:hypothetical protein FACS189429_8710 [Bacteroidia bacterium]|nr:hypothetical protein FACS189429_8710 [Bacteroidia bacterium]
MYAEISVCNGGNQKGAELKKDFSLHFLPTETIIAEIQDLINSGAKHIKINNHYLSENKQFIDNFCAEIQNKFANENFTMSCVLDTDNLLNDADILEKIKQTNKIRFYRYLCGSISR